MGGNSSKYHYKSVKNFGDLLVSEPIYGHLLLIFTVKQSSWNDPSLKAPILKLIISFLNVIRVEEAKPNSAHEVIFRFLIPFGKSNSSQFFDFPIKLNLDLSDGVKFFGDANIELNVTKTLLTTNHSYVHLSKESKLKIEVDFGLLGKPLLDDLKRLNLCFDKNEQLESLEITLKAVENDFAPKFKSEEWLKGKKEFKSGPFIDILLETAEKAQCVKKWIQSYLFVKIFDYFEKSQMRISEKKETEFEINFPENLDNFVTIFDKEPEFEYYLLKFVKFSTNLGIKGVYHSRNLYRRMFLFWFKEEKTDQISTYQLDKDIYYIFPRVEDLISSAFDAFKDFLNDDWLFNELIFPMISDSNVKLFTHFTRLIGFYGDILKNYFRSFKNKINIENHKNHPNYAYFHNLLESPEFQILPFNVLNIYGHTEYPILNGPLISTYNKYLVSFEKSFFNTLNDQKIITMIAECISKNEFYLTHVFLKSGKPIQVFTGPVKSALYFLTNEVPSFEKIKIFYDFNIDGFLNNEYTNLIENLKPIACIDLDRKQKSDDYDEFELEKPMVGKYLVVILKHNLDEEKMIIDAVGGLGFVKKEDAEKYEKLEGGGERVDLPNGPNVQKDFLPKPFLPYFYFANY